MLSSSVSKVPGMAAQVMAGCSCGNVGVEVGRIRSSRMLAAVTRANDQVHLACVEYSNWNRPLVSECPITSTDINETGRWVPHAC